MSITADCHLHSSFSGDSHTPMWEIIEQSIAKGLSTICFTEHNDFNYPPTPESDGTEFLLNADSYLYDLLTCRERYGHRIRILFGVELGLQPDVLHSNEEYAQAYDFDFIIGSTHVCHGKDPYYRNFFEGRTDEEAYREYFESVLENVTDFSDFDVCGHLDYVIRYGTHKDENYSYSHYSDVIDAILKVLISKGKGLELNTGGLKSGMKDVHPCTDILKRYKELGGEIITIGSDSHNIAHVADYFDRAQQVLQTCGFKYYTIFEKRSPEYHKI